MFRNPKTTIPGAIIAVGAVLTLIGKVISGTAGAEDLQTVLTALAGIGLVLASDGGK
jgi:hypothetical protein